MYLNINDDEITIFAESITTILCSRGLNKENQINILESYFEDVLDQLFFEYDINDLEKLIIVDKIFRYYYKNSVSDLPETSFKMLRTEFFDYCRGNILFDVNKFIDYLELGFKKENNQHDIIDRTTINFGVYDVVDRAIEHKIYEYSEVEFKEFSLIARCLLDLYNLTKEEWHLSIERWLNGFVYPLVKNEKMIKKDFDILLEQMEELDKWEPEECYFDSRYLTFISSYYNVNNLFDIEEFFHYVKMTVSNRIVDPILNGTLVKIKDLDNTSNEYLGKIVGCLEPESDDGIWSYIVKPDDKVGEYECHLTKKYNLIIL